MFDSIKIALIVVALSREKLTNAARLLRKKKETPMHPTTQVEILDRLLRIQHKKAQLQMQIEHLEESAELLSKHITNDNSNVAGTAEPPKSQPKTSTKTTNGASVSGSKKKAAKVEEQLELPSSEEEETDEAFANLGSANDEESETSVSTNDIRKLINELVKSKGVAGKEKIRVVLSKYTKNKSAMVGDILAGKNETVYAALKKI
jgi:hypothetical protein